MTARETCLVKRTKKKNVRFTVYYDNTCTLSNDDVCCYYYYYYNYDNHTLLADYGRSENKHVTLYTCSPHVTRRCYARCPQYFVHLFLKRIRCQKVQTSPGGRRKVFVDSFFILDLWLRRKNKKKILKLIRFHTHCTTL